MTFAKKTVDTRSMARRIRRHIVQMTHRGRSSHVGSGLSIADIMAVLYGKILKVDCKNPMRDDRDRFILSKGHAGAAVYATLAESGFFPVDWLKDHYKNGSIFSGHVSHKGVPGVDFSTGSLGHGLGVAAGMALSAQRTDRDYRSFVVLSDGECDEGSIWEAILFASHHKLNNLIAIVDYNKIQSLARVDETLTLEPFSEKWRAFGWNVAEINGHDHDELYNAFEQAIASRNNPSVIICHTIKGKGVSFMENSVLWHYRYPHDGEELNTALAEIDSEEKDI